MKKNVCFLILVSIILLISSSTIFAFNTAPQPSLSGYDQFWDEIAKDVLDPFDIVAPRKSFWEEHKITVIVALVGAAVLIGMILYDRSNSRGSTRDYYSNEDHFGFDDRDDDIFGEEKKAEDFDIFGDDDRFEFNQPRRGASRPARRPSGRSSGLQLIGLEGDYAGKSIPLSRDPITIGRSRDCNLVMRNYVKGISKTHCAIRFSSGRGAYQITDMGSTYGTYLNGRKIAPNTPQPLKRNDVIYLGSKRVGFRVA